MGSATHLARDEARAVSVILHPLGQQEEAKSLLLLINSPVRLDSSTGSWNPPQELYVIKGGSAHSEGELKHRKDDDSRRAADAAAEEE